MTNETAGILYVVATPIGHLKDMSLRAIEILSSVDAILVEDTRHARVLLQHYQIKKPLIAFHEHNEIQKREKILSDLSQGFSYALISDAGTPLIRDPGFDLVRAANEQAITVVPIPGACALITALCAAGLPSNTFYFGGFLATKCKQRQAQLERAKLQETTVIFYESTHRILEAISDIETIYGQTCVWVLAKELTKAHERFIAGTSTEIRTWLSQENTRVKGEFVVLLPPVIQDRGSIERQRTLSILLANMPLRQAVKLASLLLNTPKNVLYDEALRLTQGEANLLN